MSQLALPPHVQRQIDLENRRKYWAKLKRNFTIEDPRCQEYTRKLQDLSPDLYLVKANDTVEWGVPLRPGFFHLLAIPHDAPPFVTPLTNGDGYAEPGDWIFRVLARGNLRERRVRDAIRAEQDADQRDIVKEKQALKDARMERVKDIVNSATRASISMNTSVPWTQNAQGRREK